jgi:hypothetical protein
MGMFSFGSVLAPAPLALALLTPCCPRETTIGTTDCLKVVAIDLCSSKSGASGGGLAVTAGSSPCPLLMSAEFSAYREADGIAGFSAGDEIITSYGGENVGPTGHIAVGAFTSNPPGSQNTATGWVIQIETTSGQGPATFSGTF